MPTLVVRRDGRDAVLATPERQGWYQTGDLHVSHYALHRESDEYGLASVTVQVSGTAAHLLRDSPLAKGLSFEAALDIVAESALGDFLDALEQIPLQPRSPAHDDFWDSSRIQGLLNRSAIPDAAAARYLAAKTYWSAKLHRGAASFRLADARRLGYNLRGLRLIADTYENEWWTYMADPEPGRFLLRPTQLLLQRGPRLTGPSITGPLFDISGYLAGADLEASAQQFRKAVDFLTGENPDYENAIKEAVGAVESRARQMTGESTMGRAIDALTREGKIPRALGKWLTALWEYRSSMPAVGHGGLVPATTQVVEARVMVNSCASALLYLVELETDN